MATNFRFDDDSALVFESGADQVYLTRTADGAFVANVGQIPAGNPAGTVQIDPTSQAQYFWDRGRWSPISVPYMEVGRLIAGITEMDIAAIKQMVTSQGFIDELFAGQAVFGSSEDAVFIKDGVITAPKIQASESLSAMVGMFGQAFFDEAAARNFKVTNELIVENLVGKTITGATVTGGIVRGATIRSSIDDTSPGVILVSSTSAADLPGIWFSSNGTTSGTEAAIYMDSSSRLTMRGRTVSGSRVPITVDPGFWTTGNFTVGGTVTNPELVFGKQSDGRFAISSSGTEPLLFYNMTAGVTLIGAKIVLSGADVTLGVSGGAVKVNAPTVNLASIGSGTGGWALRMGSNRNLFYESSTSELKLGLRDAADEVDPWAILGLEPRAWEDREEIRTYADALERRMVAKETGQPIPELPRRPRPVFGLVVEELQAAGLDALTLPPLEPGGPGSLYYDRAWTLLIPIIRKHEETIRNLERQLNGNAPSPQE